MILSQTCPMCCKTTERNLPISYQQLYRYDHTTTPIQNVFPNLSASDREFIKTGYCDECQNILFGILEED